MTEDVIISTDFKSSTINQLSKVRKIKDTCDNDVVRDVFSYINRYLLCVPPDNRNIQHRKQKKSIIREIFYPIILETLHNMSGNFVVRSSRIEPKVLVRSQKSVGFKKKPFDDQKSQVCTCAIM